MCENWELLQQSLSEASEATMAQSLQKVTKEKNSVRLSSKRDSGLWNVYVLCSEGKKKKEKWKQPALFRRLKFKKKNI